MLQSGLVRAVSEGMWIEKDLPDETVKSDLTMQHLTQKGEASGFTWDGFNTTHSLVLSIAKTVPFAPWRQTPDYKTLGSGQWPYLCFFIFLPTLQTPNPAKELLAYPCGILPPAVPASNAGDVPSQLLTAAQQQTWVGRGGSDIPSPQLLRIINWEPEGWDLALSLTQTGPGVLQGIMQTAVVLGYSMKLIFFFCYLAQEALN